MPRTNTPQDFWRRVDVRGENECWPWTGPTTDRGYGKLSFFGRDMRAHQVAFVLTNGSLPPAVLHRCDNRPCCNPSHLFAGTNGLNNQDRAAKGRSARPAGEKHPAHVLTEAQVKSIREMRSAGSTFTAIGKAFGIHRTSARQIAVGERWGHVQ